jgi:hypothetical protein
MTVTREALAQFMHTSDQNFNWKTTGNADFVGLESLPDDARQRYLWLADALLAPDSPLHARND